MPPPLILAYGLQEKVESAGDEGTKMPPPLILAYGLQENIEAAGDEGTKVPPPSTLAYGVLLFFKQGRMNYGNTFDSSFQETSTFF